MALDYTQHVLRGIRGCLAKRPFTPADVHSRLKELGIYRQFRGKGVYHNNGHRMIEARITNRITSTSSSIIPVVQKRIVTGLSGVKKATDIPKISFASMNCRSVNNKASLISYEIVEKNIDCVTCTETWLDYEEDNNKTVISRFVSIWHPSFSTCS